VIFVGLDKPNHYVKDVVFHVGLDQFLGLDVGVVEMGNDCGFQGVDGLGIRF